MAGDLTGLRFGRLIVVGRGPAVGKNPRWRCRCDCGREAVTYSPKLKSGHTKSCGCLKRAQIAARSRRHGLRNSPEFNAWSHALGRCHRSTNAAFSAYGGRGIAVCDRWRFGEGDLNGFECFLADMGHRPSPTHTIERRDNDGPYSAENCRWATRVEQARNRRSNRMVQVAGQSMCVAQACEKLGLNHAFINARLQHGWTWDRAISQPKRPW